MSAASPARRARRELALESGIKEWGRVPALNTNSVFIQDLAEAVVEALPYVGTVASGQGKGLVPMGDIDSLLATYDADNLPLPIPEGSLWEWGWTKNAELWNGRIAMAAWVIVLLISTLQMIVQNPASM